MLKEISVKNFRSINEEILFSMEADIERVSEHSNHIINICDNSLLKVSAMYGPNGGGKTNLLSALQMVKEVVFFNSQNSLVPSKRLACAYSNSDNIEETLFFLSDSFEIGYSFSVIHKTVPQNSVDFNGNKLTNYFNYFEFISESICYRIKGSEEFIELLERNSSGEIRSDILNRLGINIAQNLASNNSVLAYLYNTYLNRSNIQQQELKVLSDLIYQIQSINSLEIDGNINLDYAIKNITKYKNKLIQLLNDVDIKITDDKFRPIQFERTIKVGDKEEKKYLDLYEESKGTTKIFWILLNVLIITHETKGGIFYCDDMNAYLHPKLYSAIVGLFNSSFNIKNQLIFNSHDILSMNKEMFRRDEIWFVYRDELYQTKVVPLSNIVNYKGEQVRKDAKYYKQYLEGKYGADPFVKRGLTWDE